MAFDPTSEKGTKIADRLKTESTTWLVTITADGAPRPVPIWFLWAGGDTIRTYSEPNTQKLKHLATNPKIALHMNSTPFGGEIAILDGTATFTDGDGANDIAYIAKYGDSIKAMGYDLERFAGSYSVRIDITITGARGW